MVLILHRTLKKLDATFDSSNYTWKPPKNLERTNASDSFPDGLVS